MWAEYSLDALQTLADRDHRYAQVVVAAAVGPRPAVRADVAATLAALVRRAEPADPAQDDLAVASVDAFLAHISDLPSEFSPAYRTATPKNLEEKASEATAFAEIRATRGDVPDGIAERRVPAMAEAELHDRLVLIEAVVADLRRRPVG